MTTHIGKIGRLKSEIREALSRRLEDGERGVEILNWLNGLPDVRRVLKEQFGGRPISKQNLSQWRNSGHVEWLQRQDHRQTLQGVAERAEALNDGAGGRDLGDQFAKLLMAEIALLGMDLLRSETDAQRRWRRVCDLRRQLTRLRREDQQVQELAFQREKQARDERIIMERAFVRGLEAAAGKPLRLGSPLTEFPQPQSVAKPGIEGERRSMSCGVQASPTQSKQKI